MWWIVLLIIASMLFSRLDDLIELFKSKNPNYQEEKQKEKLSYEQERIEIRQQLEELIGAACQITNPNLIYTASDSTRLEGVLLDLDDEWVVIQTTEKKKTRQLFLKLEEITHVSKIL
ncbi:hypothetical protein ACYSNR_18100 [Enterococcus sp. LJL128]|uniref:hypothetical protein n=1 Tax=Enterococcus sp. LJL51 TaxID=3416656 RepID=UPI003CEE51EE